MHILKCKDIEDIGIEDCDYVAKGETKEEAVNMVKEHLESEHPEEYEEAKKKWPPEEIDKIFEDSIEQNGGEEEKEEEF